MTTTETKDMYDEACFVPSEQQQEEFCCLITSASSEMEHENTSNGHRPDR